MKMVVFVLLKILSVLVEGKVFDGKDNTYIANYNTNTSQTLVENVMNTMEFRVSFQILSRVSALVTSQDFSPNILYIHVHIL